MSFKAQDHAVKLTFTMLRDLSRSDPAILADLAHDAINMTPLALAGMLFALLCQDCTIDP